MTSRSLKIAALALAATSLIAACGRDHDDLSQVRFDAAHSIALDATIAAGHIISPRQDAASIKSFANEQLMYTIGQLNGLDGGAPDMRRTEISLGAVTPRADGLFDVEYAAKLFVAWPRELAVPATLEFVLPARGDFAGLAPFFTAFGADEHGAKRCLDDGAHEVEQELLWYYYRPLKAGCPLRNADPAAVRLVAKLAVSGENTTAKAPEYAKVWEDGRLVVTAIFGKFADGATSNSDAGIAAFRSTYFDLIAKYGKPSVTNLAAGAQPSAANDDVRLTFATPAGPLDVALFLVDGIRSVPASFDAKYNERTKISDFVSYNGHSGLGANIRALARKGQFVKGQYQIFMVNGCDTFAYVDNALRDAHATANPGVAPTKFFDMITNAMPSFFVSNSRSNLAVIDALIGKTLSYRGILARFDDAQRANVTGEEDNPTALVR